VSDEELEQSETDPLQPRSGMLSTRVVVALVVIALFAGVLAAKVLAPRPAASGGAQAAAGASLTTVRNDALADYEAATKTGKPIYVLFHSLT